MINEPKNVVEQIEAALKGQIFVYKENKRRPGVKSLVNYGFPTRYAPTAYITSPYLRNYVEHNDYKLPREVAELSWIYSIASAITHISSIQIYDAKTNKALIACRKNVTDLRKELKAEGKTYYNEPQYIEALGQLEEAWINRLDPEQVSTEILDKTYALQKELTHDFFEIALQNGIGDVKSLIRARNFIPDAINSINNGVLRKDFIDTSLSEYQKNFYNEFLLERYGANTNNLPHLGEKIVQIEFSEIASFTSRLTYTGSSGNRHDFDIVHDELKESIYVHTDKSGIKPARSTFHNIASKKAEWSTAYNLIETDNNKVFLNVTCSLVGRLSKTTTIVPPYVDWLNAQDYSPQTVKNNSRNTNAISLQQQKNEEKLKLLEEELKVSEERRQARLEELRIEAEQRRIEVLSDIERHFESPDLNSDSVKGSYIDTKGVVDLLSYPELHGLLKYSSKYGVPCVSILTGLDPEHERGVQYLAAKDNPIIINGKPQGKLFQVNKDDMKNNFVQLGDVNDNTVILTSEGFATAATLYIAAKKSNLDVVVVAAMFADNVKHALKHYSTTYPNNPLYNAADNDCWNKKTFEARPLSENKGFNVALQVKDMLGADSFSLSWDGLGIKNEAQKSLATDFNDLFPLLGKEKALEVISEQLQLLVKNQHVLPCNWSPQNLVYGADLNRYVDKDAIDLFAINGVDPEMLDTEFSLPIDLELTKPEAQDINHVTEIIDENIHEIEPSNFPVSSISIQMFNNDKWEDIDYRNSPHSALNTLELEKDWAESAIFAQLLETSGDQLVDKTTARLMAKNRVEASYRCFDNDTNSPFVSMQQYVGNHDELVDRPLVIIAKSKSDKYVLPIKIAEDGNLFFRGKGIKSAEIATFNSKIAIAEAIESFLSESYFSDDLELNELDFKLAEVNEDGSINHRSKQYFSDIFSSSVSDVLESTVIQSNVKASIGQSEPEVIYDIEYKEIGLNKSVQTIQVPQSEVALLVHEIESNEEVAYVDTTNIQESDKSLSANPLSQNKIGFTVKSYARSGVMNGKYEFDTLKEANAKSADLNTYGFSTTFSSYDDSLSPLYTSIKSDLNITLKPYVTPSDLSNAKPTTLTPLQVVESISREDIESELLFSSSPQGQFKLQGSDFHEMNSIQEEQISQSVVSSIIEDELSIQNRHTAEEDHSSEYDKSDIFDLLNYNPDLEGDFKAANSDNIISNEFIDQLSAKYSQKSPGNSLPSNENSLQENFEDLDTVNSKAEFGTNITAEVSNDKTNRETSEEIVTPESVGTINHTALSIEDYSTSDNNTVEQPSHSYVDLPDNIESHNPVTALQGDSSAADIEPSHGNVDLLDTIESDSPVTPLKGDTSLSDYDFEERVSLENIELPNEISGDIEIDPLDNNDYSELTSLDAIDLLDDSEINREGISNINEPDSNVSATQASERDPVTNHLVFEKTDYTNTNSSFMNWKYALSGDFSISNTNTGKFIPTVVLQRNKPMANEVQTNSPVISHIDEKLISIVANARKSIEAKKVLGTLDKVNVSPSYKTLNNDNTVIDNEANEPTNVRLDFDPNKQDLPDLQNQNTDQQQNNSTPSQDEINSTQIVTLLTQLLGTPNTESKQILDMLADSIHKNRSYQQQKSISPANEIDVSISQPELELESGTETGIDNEEHPLHDRPDLNSISDMKNHFVTQNSEHVSSKNELKNAYQKTDAITHIIDIAAKTHGDLGGLAVTKRASFLAIVESDFQLGSEEQLDTIRKVIASSVEFDSELSNFDYSHAESVANDINQWINSIAYIGVYVEKTRDDNDRTEKFSALDKKMKDQIYKYLERPITDTVKTKGSKVIRDWVAIRDCIQQRQIPIETIKQATIGKWMGRTGHSSSYGKLLNDGVNKFVAKAIKDDLIQRSESDHNSFIYKTSVGTESSFTMSKLRYQTAVEIANREVDAALALPRNPKNYAREAVYIHAGNAFNELTNIPSPYAHLGSAKVPYRGVGRGLDGSKRENKTKNEQLETDLERA